MLALPPDFALARAIASCTTSGLTLACVKKKPHLYPVVIDFANYIATKGKAPATIELLCAREAVARSMRSESHAAKYRAGDHDDGVIIGRIMEAFKLRDGGFAR